MIKENKAKLRIESMKQINRGNTYLLVFGRVVLQVHDRDDILPFSMISQASRIFLASVFYCYLPALY